MQAPRGERTTRSRKSSPFVTATTNATAEPSNTTAGSAAAAAAAERPTTSSGNWVEPPLPAPRPSFADHGHERGGVVANMAPLGTRPSLKIMRSAARPDGGSDASGRSTIGKRTASVTPFEAMTPEPPTIQLRRRSVSTKTDDAEQLSPKTPQQSSPEKAPVVDHVVDGQAVFALSASPLPASTATTTATDTTTEPEITTPIATAADLNHQVFSPATPAPAAPSLPAQPALGEDGEPLIDLSITDRVIEDAVQLAIDNRRWPTAYALRELWDHHRSDNRIVRIIEAVYNSRATPAQLAEFRGFMKEKKKEGKKDGKGHYYYCVDESDPLPAPQSAPHTILSYGTPQTQPAMGVRSASDAQAMATSISHLSTSPLKEYDIAHIAKKQKQSHYVSPFSPMPLNGLNSIYGSGISAGTGVGAGAIEAAHAKPETPQQNGASSNLLSRARSESISSSSSLSSVDEKILDSEFPSPAAVGKQSGVGSNGGASSGGGRNNNTRKHNRSDNTKTRYSAPTEALAPHNHLNSQPPPISAPQKNGPKTFTFATVPAPPSSSSFTSVNHHLSHNHNQNPRTTESNPNSNSNSGANAEMVPIPAPTLGKPAKFISYKAKNLDKVRGRAHDDGDQSSRLKRSAREITNSSTETPESFERYQPPPPVAPPPDMDTASEGDFVDVVPSRRPAKIRLLNNRTARPRSNYDSEDLSSPTLLSFHPELAPGSVSASRAGTPSTLNRPTRKAKSGSGLRVKTSPMKKKGGGTLAGIPRASGERNSPVGNGAFANNQEDNDDYCAACGGNGDLVCCDGCTRSFHFKCVDPPMVEGALPDEWFCNQCQYQKHPPRRDGPPRSFDSLLDSLEAKNPSAFHLPKEIRECFEGVRTGSEGEYEDIVPPKPKNHKGYDEAPDFSRLRDQKGKPILCHACNKAASAPDRLIIPCSYCGLYWHLDCLESPMTKEPHSSRKWRCPAHIDDIMDILPFNLGPAHRYRKIKGSSPITSAWRRGTRNNGYIEIENSDDAQPGEGFYEDNKFGVVYKLPEEGIKLDFISKVKQLGGGIDRARLRERQRVEAAQSALWESRSVKEQQAVLNLLTLAAQDTKSRGLETLINALLAEASPAVIALIAQGDATSISQKKQKQKLSKNDKQCLQSIMAAIQSQLAEDEKPEPEPELESERASTPPLQQPEPQQPQIESPPATLPKVSAPVVETAMEVDQLVSNPVASTNKEALEA